MISRENQQKQRFSISWSRQASLTYTMIFLLQIETVYKEHSGTFSLTGAGRVRIPYRSGPWLRFAATFFFSPESLTSPFLTLSFPLTLIFSPSKRALFSKLGRSKILDLFHSPPFSVSTSCARRKISNHSFLLSPPVPPSPSSPSTPLFPLHHDQSPRSQQPWMGRTDLRPCAPLTLTP